MIGGPVESGEVKKHSSSKFKAKLNKKLVVDWKAVLDVINTGSAQIADARSEGRFMGTVKTFLL